MESSTAAVRRRGRSRGRLGGQGSVADSEHVGQGCYGVRPRRPTRRNRASSWTHYTVPLSSPCSTDSLRGTSPVCQPVCHSGWFAVIRCRPRSAAVQADLRSRTGTNHREPRTRGLSVAGQAGSEGDGSAALSMADFGRNARPVRFCRPDLRTGRLLLGPDRIRAPRLRPPGGPGRRRCRAHGPSWFISSAKRCSSRVWAS